jgi:hypothetical protein
MLFHSYIIQVSLYQIDGLAKNTRGECMESMNGPLEPGQDLAIISPKLVESLCLLLKDIEDGINRFAISELVDDLVLDQVSPCTVLEFA